MEKISNRNEYEMAKVQIEALIASATEKGLLEPDMDNDYKREIARLGEMMADYEDSYLEITPLRQKNPLIAEMDNFFYKHNMKQKEGAELLEINESTFSQIMNGKRSISISLAKRIHRQLGIDGNLILEYC